MKEGDTIKITDPSGNPRTVEVLEKISRSKYCVRDIDRGKGWNGKKYTGVQVAGGWMRGQNYLYKEEFIINKNQIHEKRNKIY